MWTHLLLQLNVICHRYEPGTSNLAAREFSNVGHVSAPFILCSSYIDMQCNILILATCIGNSHKVHTHIHMHTHTYICIHTHLNDMQQIHVYTPLGPGAGVVHSLRVFLSVIETTPNLRTDLRCGIPFATSTTHTFQTHKIAVIYRWK